MVIGLQLTHSGRYSYLKPLLAFHDPLLDPRTIVDKTAGRTADASYPILDDDYLLLCAWVFHQELFLYLLVLRIELLQLLLQDLLGCRLPMH